VCDRNREGTFAATRWFGIMKGSLDVNEAAAAEKQDASVIGLSTFATK
jgi:hypothetical protein